MAPFLEKARSECKPAVVEIRTYRYRGHSVADPDNTYRAKAEIEEYRKTKDPIQVFQNLLLGEKVLDEATVEKIDSEARAEADVAADFAEASPFPTAADLQKDVYWESDNPSQRTSGGRLFFN
jgi:pyruvate dehydrogenase E1 component alpha subunit